ncbi:MAG TPA: hypothetical protein VF928_12030 [Usitatibacteraceae bacterium]
MAKPNYDFAKRQRELAKKAKKEEKLRKKAATSNEEEEGPETDSETAPATEDKPAD